MWAAEAGNSKFGQNYCTDTKSFLGSRGWIEPIRLSGVIVLCLALDGVPRFPSIGPLIRPLLKQPNSLEGYWMGAATPTTRFRCSSLSTWKVAEALLSSRLM